ncbi:MAG: peptidoglycan-binding domain-containing protein [Rhodospirillaceae bacterium]
MTKPAVMLPTLTLLLFAAVGSAVASSISRCPGIMPPEMAGPTIEGIQRQLLQLGYRPGSNDGRLGRQTRAAISAYQRNAGLAEDGCPSLDLLNQMSFAAPPQAMHKNAVTASPVQEAQRLLTDKGVYSGPVDGKLGPMTKDAIKKFQQARDLPVTSQADFPTLTALRDTRR